MEFIFTIATAAVSTFGPMRSTPCGVRPAACVRLAPAGAEVRFADEGFALHHANGTVEAVAVPEVCHQFAASNSAIDRGSSAASSIPDGWIQSAGAYQMDMQNTIASFRGRWTVPPIPTSPQRPETLYYFIGLEDRTQGKLTTIHQPVLTWGDQTEGGLFNDSWHLWSWTCCPKNLTWHSPDIAGFAPGATIYGDIAKVGDATWRIDGAWAAADGSGWKNTTLVSQVGGFDYNYADITLEVYNLTSCAQMSTGEVEFSHLELTTKDGKRWTPTTWYPAGLTNTCDVKMKIESASAMSISTGE